MNISLESLKNKLDSLKSKKAQLEGQQLELENQRQELEKDFKKYFISVENLDQTIESMEKEIAEGYTKLNTILGELDGEFKQQNT